MPITPVSGDITSQEINDNLSYLDSEKIGKNTLYYANVKDFGAVGNYDPVTSTGSDDTQAFIEAISYLVSVGGGILVIPFGKYKTMAPINFAHDFIKIVAVTGTELYPFDCDGITFGDQAGTTRYNYLDIENLRIMMTNAQNSNGITGYNTDEINFSKTVVSGGARGLNLQYCYNLTLDGCINFGQSDSGLFADVADKMLIRRGQYGNGEKGIVIAGGKAIDLIGVSIERNNNLGLQLMSSMTRGGEYPDGVNLIGNYLERNAMLRGNGFIEFGTYNANVNDYAKGINLIGNYFNWDTANPRTPSVPFIAFDRCTKVTVQSNRYANSTNYSSRTSQTDLNRVIALNDECSSGRGVVESSINQFVLPFSVDVPTDATGGGSYTYSVASLNYSAGSIKATGTANTNVSANTFVTFSYPNNTSVVVNVTGATANSSVNVTGLIMGEQL